MFVLPGNHDLNSSSAARFEGDGYTRVDGVTAGEFAVLYHAFGFDGALSRDADSLSYMAALSDDLRLLMLDVNTSAAPNAVLQGTLSWARRQLMQAQADGCRVVAVSHQNLIDHSGLLSSGFTIRNADALRRLYAVSPVLCNLSGHIHLQHMGQTDSGLWDIATSSLAVSPNQYGVLTLTEDALTYRTAPVRVSDWAAAQGLSDPICWILPPIPRIFSAPAVSVRRLPPSPGTTRPSSWPISLPRPTPRILPAAWIPSRRIPRLKSAGRRRAAFPCIWPTS